MPVAVSIVTSGGLPVTQVASNAAPFTVWPSGGLPISLGNSGLPVVLLNPDGSSYSAGGDTTPQWLKANGTDSWLMANGSDAWLKAA